MWSLSGVAPCLPIRDLVYSWKLILSLWLVGVGKVGFLSSFPIIHGWILLLCRHYCWSYLLGVIFFNELLCWDMGFLMSFIFWYIYFSFFVVVVFWDLINFLSSILGCVFFLLLSIFFFFKIKPSNGNSYIHSLSFSFSPYLLLAAKWITGPYLFQ